MKLLFKETKRFSVQMKDRDNVTRDVFVYATFVADYDKVHHIMILGGGLDVRSGDPGVQLRELVDIQSLTDTTNYKACALRIAIQRCDAWFNAVGKFYADLSSDISDISHV